MKKVLTLILVLLLSIAVIGCSKTPGDADPGKVVEPREDVDPVKDEDNSTVIYENTQYGFSFSLPEGWRNYEIRSEQWEGLPLGEDSNDSKDVETGPLISIRHPEWTSADQRQDIPIMIFTLDQWESLEKEEFHIGAAPMGPKELAHNSKYVFALPARYNYAFPKGYEEVEKILEGNPLQANENIDM
ncbi:MAG TPA: hypothetical protein GX687_04220 [Clostridia bacterium]|nr:hypothetical protein [Clostridia bacterium]